MNVMKRLIATAETERLIHDGLRKRPLDRVVRVNVFIRGEIDETLAVAVADRLRSHPHARTVAVHIDSPGGFINATVDIIGALWGHHGRKIAYVRRAASAAFLTMLACDLRYSTTNAQFLHHSARLDGKIVRHRDIQMLMNMLCMHAGLSDRVSETLQRWGDSDRGFHAPEALALGLIHDAGSEYYPASADDVWRRGLSARRRLVRQISAGEPPQPDTVRPIGFKTVGTGRHQRRMPIFGEIPLPKSLQILG